MGAYEFNVISNFGISFFVYLVIHFSLFRFIPSRHILTALVINYLIGLAVSVIFILFTWPYSGNSNFIAALKTEFICIFMYTIICFIYVLCVFGPYESSIRLRLLRDLYSAGENGLSWEEILKNYNTRLILKIRIDRFLGSGEVILIDNKLTPGKHKFVFQTLENIANFLRNIIGIKHE